MTLHVSSKGIVIGQLELPAPPDEAAEKLRAIQARTHPEDVLSIFNAECVIPGIGWLLQHTALEGNLEKLNRLAETIDGMNEAGHYQLCKALTTNSRQGLDGILQTAAHIGRSSMDRYEVIPGVKDHRELGRWLVEHDHLAAEVPGFLRPHLDYRSIGISYCNAHEGEFLANGYTGMRTGILEQAVEEPGVLRLTLTAARGGYNLSLPASDEDLEQVQRALGLDGFAQAGITEVNCSIPGLSSLLPLDTICVEDANTLAFCLQEMEQEDGGMMKFCAALEAEQPDTFTEALNIAMDRDDYELVPEDMDEYGRQVLRRTGADDEIIDTIDGYMDFARLGADSMAEDGVRRTGFGLVRRLSEPFPMQQETGLQMM